MKSAQVKASAEAHRFSWLGFSWLGRLFSFKFLSKSKTKSKKSGKKEARKADNEVMRVNLALFLTLATLGFFLFIIKHEADLRQSNLMLGDKQYHKIASEIKFIKNFRQFLIESKQGQRTSFNSKNAEGNSGSVAGTPLKVDEPVADAHGEKAENPASMEQQLSPEELEQVKRQFIELLETHFIKNGSGYNLWIANQEGKIVYSSLKSDLVNLPVKYMVDAFGNSVYENIFFNAKENSFLFTSDIWRSSIRKKNLQGDEVINFNHYVFLLENPFWLVGIEAKKGVSAAVSVIPPLGSAEMDFLVAVALYFVGLMVLIFFLIKEVDRSFSTSVRNYFINSKIIKVPNFILTENYKTYRALEKKSYGIAEDYLNFLELLRLEDLYKMLATTVKKLQAVDSSVAKLAESKISLGDEKTVLLNKKFDNYQKTFNRQIKLLGAMVSEMQVKNDSLRLPLADIQQELRAIVIDYFKEQRQINDLFNSHIYNLESLTNSVKDTELVEKVLLEAAEFHSRNNQLTKKVIGFSKNLDILSQLMLKQDSTSSLDNEKQQEDDAAQGSPSQINAVQKSVQKNIGENSGVASLVEALKKVDGKAVEIFSFADEMITSMKAKQSDFNSFNLTQLGEATSSRIEEIKELLQNLEKKNLMVKDLQDSIYTEVISIRNLEKEKEEEFENLLEQNPEQKLEQNNGAKVTRSKKNHTNKKASSNVNKTKLQKNKPEKNKQKKKWQKEIDQTMQDDYKKSTTSATKTLATKTFNMQKTKSKSESKILDEMAIMKDLISEHKSKERAKKKNTS